MNIYLLIPLIEFTFCVVLLVILMVGRRWNNARRPFLIFPVFMALWGLFVFMTRASPSLASASFWEIIVFRSILSIALFLTVSPWALGR